MSKRIIVDPITRIEGHLKIEVEIENGKVKDAWSSGTMYRGFEKLLEKRHPFDAPYITSRFCGVCFSVHSMASVLALENALGIDVPEGGRLIRNLLMGAEYLYDHILHFYHLSALDYLDVLAVTEYQGNDRDLLEVKGKLAGLISANDAHPLYPRYEPDEFCIRDPETVLTLVKHYLDALHWQMMFKKLGAIFGGRAPHYQTIVTGGVTQLPTADQISHFRTILTEGLKFVRDVYFNDVMAVGTGALFPLAQSGFGQGHVNYIAYGAFSDADGKNPLFKSGVITDNIDDIDEFDQEKIRESVTYAWYEDAKPVHPYQGTQAVQRDKDDAYSFIKAPRYAERAFEVGPLARMLVMRNERLMALVKQGVQPGVVARHACRAIESLIIGDAMEQWVEDLSDSMASSEFQIHADIGEISTDAMEGAGFYEAPRGALGHWVQIEKGVLKRYQAVVPSTWNASPRDENGIRGQYEESLIGVPVPDENNPINVVRVIRSFDPCLACAVHMIHPETNAAIKYVIDPMMGK